MSNTSNVQIPQSHVDLLKEPVVVTLVTVMPDGTPQATPVWTDWTGEHLIVNTARGRQKDRNMERRSKVAILAVDPTNPYRWLEIRGEVDEISEEDGVEWINRLSKKYRGIDEYYSGPNGEELRKREQRVTYRIRPTRVNKGG